MRHIRRGAGALFAAMEGMGAGSMNNTQSKTLLTEGSIWRKMVAFALPLFFGNLFQQLYNTADSLIVGNFLGSNALAAVSSSGSLIFLLVGFFNGIAMGAGVVIARYYGAREINELQKAIHTTVVFGILCGLVLMTAGRSHTGTADPHLDEDAKGSIAGVHCIFPGVFYWLTGICTLR